MLIHIMRTSALKSKDTISLLLCFSLSELVSLLKNLRSGWGPPLDLLVRMVNSNFWVMEADMWADLLILARWSNPTINREDVLCNICKDVWIQPTTLFCGHVFCASCLQTWINDQHKECPSCHKEIKGVMTFSEAAEKLLMHYHKERRVSFEKFNSTCIKACISCEPPPHQESIQLHECSIDEVSTRPILKNTQEKITGEILSGIFISRRKLPCYSGKILSVPRKKKLHARC